MSSYVQLLKWTVVVYVLCIVLERMVPFDVPLLTLLNVTNKLARVPSPIAKVGIVVDDYFIDMTLNVNEFIFLYKKKIVEKTISELSLLPG